MPVIKRSKLLGRTRGKGRKGGSAGGDGAGLGGSARIAIEEVHRFSLIYGGVGGDGGAGGILGGNGGIGQGQTFGTRLVSVDGSAIVVPTLTLAEFCQEYRLSDKIRNLLDEAGFETAGALLEVSDVSLLEDGFKRGQIAEMRRALKEFLTNQGVPIT
ncbi:hypothetical protein FB451DRAFT_1358744 [Mycena latifolia]|nr:hypothetical protein FB451DRAFT_1358744 [Mycena latifolia]